MTRYNRHRSASERPERPDGKRYQSKRTSSVTKSVQTGPRFVSDRTDEELESIVKYSLGGKPISLRELSKDYKPTGMPTSISASGEVRHEEPRDDTPVIVKKQTPSPNASSSGTSSKTSVSKPKARKKRFDAKGAVASAKDTFKTNAGAGLGMIDASLNIGNGIVGMGNTLVNSLMKPDMFGSHITSGLASAAQQSGQLRTGAIDAAIQGADAYGAKAKKEEFKQKEKQLLAAYGVSSVDQLSGKDLTDYQRYMSMVQNYMLTGQHGGLAKWGGKATRQAVQSEFGRVNEDIKDAAAAQHTRAKIDKDMGQVDVYNAEDAKAQAQASVDQSIAQARRDMAITAFNSPEFAPNSALDSEYIGIFGPDYRTDPQKFEKATEYYFDNMSLRQSTDLLSKAGANASVANTAIDNRLRALGLDPTSKDPAVIAQRARLMNGFVATSLIPGGQLYSAMRQQLSDDQMYEKWEEARKNLFNTPDWTQQMEQAYNKFMSEYKFNKDYFETRENAQFMQELPDKIGIGTHIDPNTGGLTNIDPLTGQPSRASSAVARFLWDNRAELYEGLQNGTITAGPSGRIDMASLTGTLFRNADIGSLKAIMQASKADTDSYMDYMETQISNMLGGGRVASDLMTAWSSMYAKASAKHLSPDKMYDLLWAQFGQYVPPAQQAQFARLADGYMRRQVEDYRWNYLVGSKQLKTDLNDSAIYLETHDIPGTDGNLVNREDLIRTAEEMRLEAQAIDNASVAAMRALDAILDPNDPNAVQALRNFKAESGLAANTSAIGRNNKLNDIVLATYKPSTYRPAMNASSLGLLNDIYRPIYALSRKRRTPGGEGFNVLSIPDTVLRTTPLFRTSFIQEKEIGTDSRQLLARMMVGERLDRTYDIPTGTELGRIGESVYAADPNTAEGMYALNTGREQYMRTVQALNNKAVWADYIDSGAYKEKELEAMLEQAKKGLAYTSIRTTMNTSKPLNDPTLDVDDFRIGSYSLMELATSNGTNPPLSALQGYYNIVGVVAQIYGGTDPRISAIMGISVQDPGYAATAAAQLLYGDAERLATILNPNMTSLITQNGLEAANNPYADFVNTAIGQKPGSFDADGRFQQAARQTFEALANGSFNPTDDEMTRVLGLIVSASTSLGANIQPVNVPTP